MSSPPGFCPHQEPWRFRCLNFCHCYFPWFPSSHTSVFTDTHLRVHFIIFLFAVGSGMKFTFETKTEPVTQAAIIIDVFAFSSGSSEVEPKLIFMGHEIWSCHAPVVISFFILFETLVSFLSIC